MPVGTVTPYIGKSGQLAHFFLLLSGTLENVLHVTANPTISVNGNVVQIDGPYWRPVKTFTPWVTYHLDCGPVLSVVVQAGGSGYVAPTAAVSGGGGSGCVLGTPVMSGGVITSIPVTTAGSGYTSPPTVVITDGSGTGAVAVAVMGGACRPIRSPTRPRRPG